MLSVIGITSCQSSISCDAALRERSFCRAAKYRTLDGFAQGGTFHLVYELPENNDITHLPDSLTKYFSRIDKSLSGYDSTSTVSRINRGENPPLDSLFIECFNLSNEVYQATEGAFDISAAPFFDIWGFGFKEKEKITREKIDSIKQFVGMDKLSIAYDQTSGAHYLHKADSRMKVNLNAIAQGYSCDFIARRLEATSKLFSSKPVIPASMIALRISP